MAATTSQPITVLQLSAFIGDTIRGMSNFQVGPALKALEISAVSDVKMRFATGTGPDGHVWAPLRHRRIIPGKDGDKPLRDNGLLMASISAKASRSELVVGSNLAYAGVHQWGGIITPKKAKFLTIPMTKDAKKAGSPRRFRGQLSPRINRAGTGGVLVDVNGTVQYVMTKRVVVPARPFLGFSPNFMKIAELILADFAVRHAFGGSGNSVAQGIIDKWEKEQARAARRRAA